MCAFTGVVARCPGCGVEFNAEDIAGKATCPVCGAALEPSSDASRDDSQHATPTGRTKRRGLPAFLFILLTIIFLYAASTQVTFFVVQPLGAIPEGRTVLIPRLNKTNFIDSADAMCERHAGGVSLLCRGMMLGAVVEKSRILLRLPYSETLYLISTDGKQYAK